MKIAIVGLGLIGGSIAKALKKHHIIGVDKDPETLKLALEQGVIDSSESPEIALTQADVIFLCIYPQESLAFVRKYAEFINPFAILTDVVGIKKPLCELCKAYSFTYVGGHPMAGRETVGYANADANIFKDKSYILTERNDLLEKLVLEMGFKPAIVTTPENHDEIIAYTSQLPHIIAPAMCDSPMYGKHGGFTGGSFEDMTRIARINENLWTELFISNAEYLVPQIENLENSISRIKNAIINKDENRLKNLLAEVRIKREDNC